MMSRSIERKFKNGSSDEAIDNNNDDNCVMSTSGQYTNMSSQAQELVLPPRRSKKKKKKKENGAVEVTGSLAGVMSKGMKRREKIRKRKVEQENERKRRRRETMERLEKSRVPDNHLSLLQSSSKLGQKDTLRQRLTRELKMEKSGLEIEIDNENRKGKGLYVAVGVDETDNYSENDDTDNEDDDDDDKNNIKTQNTLKNVQDTVDERPGAEMGSCKSRIFSMNDHAKVVYEKLVTTENTIGMSKQAVEKAIQASRLEIACDGDGRDDSEDNDNNINDTVITMNPVPIPDYNNGEACVVHVQRSENIQVARELLPILSYEQEIIEMVSNHDIIILCGETGSGKTTQIPQFLYEAGYGCQKYPHRSGMIGITQPRRIAATSTAVRVSEELGKGDLSKSHIRKDAPVEGAVGYQIRHDRRVQDGTSMKFMTDGILLREIQEDFLLSAYSVIIIDEAHERTVNTDILIGLLSRVVPLRRRLSVTNDKQMSDRNHYPLKLIIMSATLRVEDFTSNNKLFASPPPVINIPARQYPVTVHFSRRTEMKDYVRAVEMKASAIHKRLPPGGILVFVTGQAEVEYLCNKLRESLQRPKRKGMIAEYSKPLDDNVTDAQKASRPVYDDENDDISSMNDGEDHPSTEIGAYSIDQIDGVDNENDVKLWGSFHEWDLQDDKDDYDDECMEDDDGESDIEDDWEENEEEKAVWGKFDTTNDEEGMRDMEIEVLPLYAMLPRHKQQSVFSPCNAAKVRRIVVATNVAETSLTIPGIRYVVDSGRSKQVMYDARSGMASFEVRWISKASAEQRSGRSGRTGPGHCYRVYSSPVFVDIFPEHANPDICRVPLDGVLLNMRSIGIEKVRNFPFPSPPSASDIDSSEQVLFALGALDHGTNGITEVGRIMSRIPVSPRHSRTLIAAFEADKRGVSDGCVDTCLQYAFAIVAALSTESPFLHDEGGKDEKSVQKREKIKNARREFHDTTCEAIGLASILISYERQGRSDRFCQRLGLHTRLMKEMSDLRRQLVSTAAKWCICETSPYVTAVDVSKLPSSAPSAAQHIALRTAICCGWSDRVARRLLQHDVSSASTASGHANENGMTKMLIARRPPYRSCALSDDEVYIHPRSPLARHAPDYLVYSELIEKKRKYMYGITVIDPKWLVICAPNMVTLSKPLQNPPPWYDSPSDSIKCWHKASYGPDAWPLSTVAKDYLNSDSENDKEKKYAIFANALLKGRVFKLFKLPPDQLTESTESFLRTQSQGMPCVKGVLQCLALKDISSREALSREWHSNPSFLRKEMLCWIRASFISSFEMMWQQMVDRSQRSLQGDLLIKRKQSSTIQGRRNRSLNSI